MSDVEHVDQRELKLKRAISLTKLRHAERYGTDAIDENYIRSLPDWQLDKIIDPGKSTPVI